jgi:hypothetical protein
MAQYGHIEKDFITQSTKLGISHRAQHAAPLRGFDAGGMNAAPTGIWANAIRPYAATY